MAIHPTAQVDKKAQIDPSVTIGPFCVVEGNAQLSAGCVLLHNVFISGWTRVGLDCVIHPGAIIGHEPQDTKYKGERSYCRIGNRVTIREYATIHRGTDPESETVVGDGCLLMAGAHVAHNCVLGEGVTLINNVLLAGHVRVFDRAVLGGGAVVHQFVRIGSLAMIPGHGRIPKDVVPYALPDVEGRIVGINRVGLRRAGYTHDDLKQIREAYRILFESRRTHDERLSALREMNRSPFLDTLLSFVESDSARGLAGRARQDQVPITEAAENKLS